MVYLCLPFSTASFMMLWVGVNVSWLASHPLCVWMGAHLKLSVVILLLYWCPCSSLVYTYALDERMRALWWYNYLFLCECVFFSPLTYPECMCVLVPFIPWPSIPRQMKYWWKALNDLAPAHCPSKFGFDFLFQMHSNQHIMETGGALQKCNPQYHAPFICYYFLFILEIRKDVFFIAL